METSFLFIDESFSDQTEVTSLTGLLVPVKDYASLRAQFYAMILNVLFPEQDMLLTGKSLLPELHARALLKDHEGASDEKRILLSERVVDLVIANRLEVYRVGYFRTRKLREIFKRFGDANLQGLCFQRLLFRLQDKLATEMIIPVMDGFDSLMVSKFSSLVKNLDVIRATGLWQESDLSIKYSVNLLGEVFYADSQFAVFTQVVDMISYLRHVSDISRKGIDLSPFKMQLLKVSESLSPVMTYEEIISIRVQDTV